MLNSKLFNQHTAIKELTLLRITILIAIYFSWRIPLQEEAQWEHAITIFGLLPRELAYNFNLFVFLKITTALSGVAWFFMRALPLSAWLTTIGYTLTISQGLQTYFYTIHIYHVVNVILIVQSAWFHYYRRSIAKDLFSKRSLTAPGWVLALLLYYLCFTYSLSGWTKLMHDPSWANGTTLQLWIYTHGRPDSWVGKLLLWDQRIALSAQLLTLIAECAAFLALFSDLICILLGLILLTFHILTFFSFGHPFYGNIVAVFVIMLWKPAESIWKSKRL